MAADATRITLLCFIGAPMGAGQGGSRTNPAGVPVRRPGAFLTVLSPVSSLKSALCRTCLLQTYPKAFGFLSCLDSRITDEGWWTPAVALFYSPGR